MLSVHIFFRAHIIPGVEMEQVAVAAAMDWEHVQDWVVDRHAEGMAVDVHWVRDWLLAMDRWVATIWVMVRCTV